MSTVTQQQELKPAPLEEKMQLTLTPKAHELIRVAAARRKVSVGRVVSDIAEKVLGEVADAA